MRRYELSTLVPGSSKVIQDVGYYTSDSVMAYGRRRGWSLKTTAIKNGIIVHRLK